MQKNHSNLEQTIIHALSKPLSDPFVKECIAILGEYQTVEAPHDGSISFFNAASDIALNFDAHDVLIKVEISFSLSNKTAFSDLLQKYTNRHCIYQQLGKPTLVQKTLLAYDLSHYWMRFELQEDITKKIVYLALSSIGKNYRSKEILLRTCKSSGKR